MPTPQAGFPPAHWAFPFVVLVLAIAVLPVLAPRFWESNWRKLGVAATFAAPVLALYAVTNPSRMLEPVRDYVSFIVLIGGLFVIAGGIVLDGDLRATPRSNVGLLGLGALLASFIGTTGASMLLIRPVLVTNRQRKHVAHTIVFFIFLVSNIGGCLTPLGDPPLFLGYLAGVPFPWTFRLLVPWAFTVALVLVVYGAWDLWAYARESSSDISLDGAEIRPLRVFGKRNLAFLAGVVLAVAGLAAPWRELTIVFLAATSYLVTDGAVRTTNRFTFAPLFEVAALFAGIFVTMRPALELLEAHASSFGLRNPWHFFWTTGALSSVLDNAPTYKSFFSVAKGLGLPSPPWGVPDHLLVAISLGAVFMGANTYIGNGPNLMVRAIAEDHGVKMPSFGRYMLYSCGILLPIFLLLAFVFFR